MKVGPVLVQMEVNDLLHSHHKKIKKVYEMKNDFVTPHFPLN